MTNQKYDLPLTQLVFSGACPWDGCSKDDGHEGLCDDDEHCVAASHGCGASDDGYCLECGEKVE